MKGINDKFPDYKLPAVVSSEIKDAFTTLSSGDFLGQWQVYFFWPKDFTFVCPTEIRAFNELYDQFAQRDAVILGGSTDSDFVHLAWRQQNKLLEGLRFPMLSDIKRELASELGILDKNEGVMQRATYIVDPDGVIRFTMVTDLNVGRNPKEVLRVLDALQTKELCACNWQPGEAVIDKANANSS